jgi:antitoxin HigA-1
MIHTHPHPGDILKTTVFEPLNLTVTEAAERLSMSRVALSRVVNGKAGISSDLALRLEKAGASTARFWINLQANYDLWVAMKHKQPRVRALRDTAA